MKTYPVIFFSILIYLLFSSKSCESPGNSDYEENTLNATLDSLNKSFEAEYPSDQTLRAFEMKASQKLTDFSDYLQIFHDTSLDATFKEHTRQMIRELFISDTIHIDFRISEEQKVTNLTMSNFFNILSSSDFKPTSIIIDSIIISDPLQRSGEGKYSGSLKFIQRLDMPAGSHNGSVTSFSKTIDIIATRINKSFGDDTLYIWQVYLGDIR